MLHRSHWGAVLLAGMLSACAQNPAQDFLTGAQWDVEGAAALPLSQDPYLAGLQEGYIEKARIEAGEFDWPWVTALLAKARAAAAGQASPPFNPQDFNIPANTSDGLADGYVRLTGYLASDGAMLRARRQIGDAQVAFDCWLGEAREGHQDADIAACRAQFDLLMQLILDLAALPADMAVVLPEDGPPGGIEVTQGNQTISLDRPFAAAATGAKLGDVPVTEREIRDAFADALEAQPKPPVEFVLTFAFNDTRIQDAAFEQSWPPRPKPARARPPRS